jgi:glutaredoxin
MKKYMLLLILFSVFLCQTAVADFYKWVDEKGETQITDYPPPQDKAAKNVEFHKTENPVNSENKDDPSKNKDKKKFDVVLYTKNDCMDCDKAREFLKSKNIFFTEYNMDTDKDAAIKRKEIDNSEDVPFAIINRSQIFGFSESVYNKVLQMEPDLK